MNQLPSRPLSSSEGSIRRVLYNAVPKSGRDNAQSATDIDRRAILDLQGLYGDGLVCIFTLCHPKAQPVVGGLAPWQQLNRYLTGNNRLSEAQDLLDWTDKTSVNALINLAKTALSKEFNLSLNNIIIEISPPAEAISLPASCAAIDDVVRTIRDPFMTVIEGASTFISVIQENGTYYSAWLDNHKAEIRLSGKQSNLTFHGGNHLYSCGVLFIGKDSVNNWYDPVDDQVTARIKQDLGFDDCEVVLVGGTRTQNSIQTGGPSYQPFRHIDLFIMLGRAEPRGRFEFFIANPDIRYQQIDQACVAKLTEMIDTLKKQLNEISENICERLRSLGFDPVPILFPLPLIVQCKLETYGTETRIYGIVPYINGLVETNKSKATITTGCYHSPLYSGDVGLIDFDRVRHDLNNIACKYNYLFNFIYTSTEGFAGLHCHTLELERG
jgi:hypothetical protein